MDVVEEHGKASDSWVRALLVAFCIPLLNSVFLGIAGMARLGGRPASFSEAMSVASQSTWNLGLAQAAAVVFLLLLAWPHRDDNAPAVLRVRPVYGFVAVLCLVAGVGMQFLLAELGNLTQELWPIPFDQLAFRMKLFTPASWTEGIGAVTAFVLIAPVTEEIVFRGWLMGALESRFNPRVALVASSVAFGLVHLSPDAIVYATVAGLLLGWVVQRSGSLLAGIALHAGVNATPLLLPAHLLRVPGFNTLDDTVTHVSPAVLFGAAVVTASALYVFARVVPKQTPDTQEQP